MSALWIAEQRVVFVRPDGTRTEGRIAIGMPHQQEQDSYCPVALDGLERTFKIFGDDTLQALMLGARFLGMQLHGFLSRGGRVLYAHADEDVDVALSAVFGPFLRAPPSTESSPARKRSEKNKRSTSAKRSRAKKRSSRPRA